MPSSSAARMTSVPFGMVISNPSMVTWTPSVSAATEAGSFVCKVTSVPPSRAPTASPGISEQRGGRRVERAAAPLLVLEVLVPEIFDRRDDRADRPVGQRAERPAEDVVTHVEQLLQVFLAALAVLEPVQDADHPLRSITAGR